MTDSLDEEFVKLLKSLHSSKNEIEPFIFPEETGVIWKPISFKEMEKVVDATVPTAPAIPAIAAIPSQAQSTVSNVQPILQVSNVPNVQVKNVTSPNVSVVSGISQKSQTDIFSLIDTKSTSTLSNYFNEISAVKSSEPVLQMASINEIPTTIPSTPTSSIATPLSTPATPATATASFSTGASGASTLGKQQLPSTSASGSMESSNSNGSEIKLKNQKIEEFKISKNQYNWIYFGAFIILIILMFAYIWWYYVKDYKKFLEKKSSKLLKDEETLRNLNEEQKTKFLESERENQDAVYEEAETLLSKSPNEEKYEMVKEEKDDDAKNGVINDEYSEEYFEPMKILNSLQSEKSKKIVLSRSFFDLSDVNQKDMIPTFQEKERHSIPSKLSDESPEVNEYAKKREKLLESL